jgi:hypothetical protein
MPRRTGDEQRVANEAAEPAATATAATATAATARGRGRPKASLGNLQHRVKTVKFDLDHAVNLFHPVASMCYHPSWSWDGRCYPKTKRSHGPNMQSLNEHGAVLLMLFHLAPNGYPDPYRLRDLLMRLQDIYGILNPRHEADKYLSLSSVAILAADRWRIMCKHCLMIVKGGAVHPPRHGGTS